MKKFVVFLPLFFLACGELGNKDEYIYNRFLLAHEVQSGLKNAGSYCGGINKSSLTESKKNIHIKKPNLSLLGHIPGSVETIEEDDDRCNDVSIFLRNSKWIENGHEIANPLKLDLTFGSESNFHELAETNGSAPVEIESAILNFKDGTSTPKPVVLNILCSEDFNFICPKDFQGRNDCSNYEIGMTSQSCLFYSSPELNINLFNMSKSKIKIFGEIFFNETKASSITVKKVEFE